MDLTEYIKPELLVLVPVLIIIGKIVKETELFDNKHIPVILGIISMVLSSAWVIIQGGEGVPQAILTGVIQGILLAGTAVYGNQILKQYTKNGDDNNGLE